MRAYAKRGHEVLAVVPRLGGTPLELTGYRLVEAENLAVALQAIMEFAPDALACHAPDPDTLPGQVAGVMAGSVHTVLWIHGYESLYTAFYGYGQHWWQLPRSLIKCHRRMKVLRGIMDKCATVVYVSEWMRREGQRGTGCPACRTAVIPNPIDSDVFYPQSERLEHPRLKAISVRSFKKKYGLDLAIRAFSRLACADLTVVGSGTRRKKLVGLAKVCKSLVTFLPSVYTHEQLSRLYMDYDVFIAPSRVEAQGVAMCEAMSCGLPVIATRVGGIPEFVEDGVTGILVPPGDVKGIREAVCSLRPDQAIDMGRKARAAIVAKCSLQRVIPRELAVLEGRDIE